MQDKMQFSEASELFSRNGINLTQEKFDKLSQYAELLTAESSRQNVTAVRTISEIWVRHFLDAAYMMRYFQDGQRIIDIGTGGGVPAIPLSIMNPALQITMLDSELRKIEFCDHAINALGISAKAICGRAEELASKPEYRAQFDAAVSRAMASGSMLTELSVPFLKLGDALFAMKGRQYDPAAERFYEAADTLGCTVESVEEYILEGETKYLITVRKSTDTPPQYPRRFAKIKRQPL